MSPRISVARIFSRLNIGGPSVHVILVSATLDPSRFQSTLIVGHEGPTEGNMFELAARYGVRPVRIPSLGREISVWNDLWTTMVLWRWMRKARPHVVHTHTSKAGFSGRLAARLAGVPVIVHTFHGHVFDGYFGPVLTRMFILLERLLGRLSDAIITISGRLKDELVRRKIAPADKICVIELGLDLDAFLAVKGRSGVLRAQIGIDSETPLVGIVGRLVPIKDHRTFLQAAARVREKHPRVRFAIIGDGELRSALQAFAAEAGIEAQVYFAGWQKDLAPIYADLDLVVISSRNEGTPVSIIEGFASGRPAVATRVGGIPDLVQEGKNGLLVPPGDPVALAQGIIRIIEDPEMARLFGGRGREEIRARYGVQRLASDLGRLYCDLLARKGIRLQETGKSVDGMA